MDGEPHEQSILVEHPPVEQLPPKDSHQVTFNLEFQLEIPPPKQGILYQQHL